MKRSVLTACTIAIFSTLFLSCKVQTSQTSDDASALLRESTSVNSSNSSAKYVSTGVDFTVAAEKSLNSVVHIITYSKGRQSNVVTLEDLFGSFFGQPRRQPQNTNPRPVGSGSGVILDNLGYIVTNNHVVQGADRVTVTLNDKREFDAQIIGLDPSTDLALLKIEAEDLSPIEIGNSDNLKVGEWVLAVGNPFNITSTVTAGIVITDISNEFAKANNVNRLDGVFVVEVGQNGGAKDAGMQNGDVIIAVDNAKVKSVAEIQDRLTRFSPGDEVKVTVDRQGELMTFNVKLHGTNEYQLNTNE